MNDLVLLGKAFADPTRVRILAALRISELCVCELADAMELSLSTLSTHLQMIRQAGAIATRREGKWIYYALDPEHATLVEALFARYAAGIAGDRRLKRDAQRIARRLKLREDGACLLGFGQLDRKGGDNNDPLDSSAPGAARAGRNGAGRLAKSGGPGKERCCV